MNNNFKGVATITPRNSDCLKKFFKDIRNIPLLTPQEERELIAKAQQGDQEAIDKLIVSNIRFCISLAKKYIGRGVLFEDLISEGIIGLYDAIKNFDLTNNVRFNTYSCWWISQAISSAIVKYSKTVKLPISQVLKLTKINKLERTMEQNQQRSPSLSELANVLNTDLKKIVKIQNFGSLSTSLDKKIKSDDDFILLDVLPNDSIPPDDNLMKESVKTLVDNLLNQLTPREATILKYTFGIDCDPLIICEIAKKVNLTDERVRQIKNQALDKLKNIVKTTDLNKI